ncbi:hypothetical protein GUJ93_ZPchr0004g38278 [Zizania palustris]|uniref:Uncharacterized protein n=1 Tax=Zizania palustris TaxID=103762 RepID=A0A8J5SHL1_ZIZPA|nr:hypothetical protein GUJ93_ZPchr0004g38278 [Zizania palustris]
MTSPSSPSSYTAPMMASAEPSSSPPSTSYSVGPASLRARLYAVFSAHEFELIAELTGCALSPPGNEVELRGDEPDRVASTEPGDLLLVLLQEGRVQDMAYLCFVRRPPSLELEEENIDTLEHVHIAADDGSNDDDGLDVGGPDNDGFDDDGSDEDDKWFNESESDMDYSLQLRLWANSGHANLVMLIMMDSMMMGLMNSAVFEFSN